jgi:hypothetical protein
MILLFSFLRIKIIFSLLRFFWFDVYLLFKLVYGLCSLRTILCCLVSSSQ